jgi:hypothetical protein
MRLALRSRGRPKGAFNAPLLSNIGPTNSSSIVPALNFTEIAPATAGPDRDSFELFARDVLEFVGFGILEGPDRGADGGRDLIVEELRTGVGGETRVRWLVSCKHKAHSGSSVTPADEPDIQDRLNTHSCTAFLGFYSTIPSSGLSTKLTGAASKFGHQVYDSERIERVLLHSADGLLIAKRYFPKSVERWKVTDRKPVKIFAGEAELNCDHCGKDLLLPEARGIVAFWHPFGNPDDADSNRTEHVYFACKGHCDQVLRYPFLESEMIDGWEDISDLLIPTIYLRWMMGTVNRLHNHYKYSDQAFEKTKDLLLHLFPMICRHLSEEDKDRVSQLQELPAFLGGLG